MAMKTVDGVGQVEAWWNSSSRTACGMMYRTGAAHGVRSGTSVVVKTPNGNAQDTDANLSTKYALYAGPAAKSGVKSAGTITVTGTVVSGGKSHVATVSFAVSAGTVKTTGVTVHGKTSCFNDSTTASGISAATHQGIALPRSDTMKQYWSVRFANGKTLVLQQIDWGPASWTGRVIDISAPAAAAAGYGTNCGSSPITDTVVTATLIGPNK